MFTRLQVVLASVVLAVSGLIFLWLGTQPLGASGPVCNGSSCSLVQTTTDDFVRGEFYATGLRKLQNEDGSVQLLPVGLSSPWQPTTELPGLRAELALVSYNNILYAIGGYDGSNTHTEIYSATTSLVPGDIIDPPGWEVADNLPAPRAGPAAIIALTPNPLLYVVGGGEGAGSDTIYYKKIGSGGSLGGSWSTTTLPETGVVYAGAVVRNANLYVLGGRTGSSNKVYRLPILNGNGDLGSAEEVLQLPHPLRLLGAVSWNGASDDFVYVVGGLDNFDSASADVNFTSFGNLDDPNNGVWQNASLVDAFSAHGVVQHNGGIFVVGGRQGIAASDTITKVQTALIEPDGSLHNWGGSAGNWIVTEPLPQPLSYHGTTVNAGGEIFVADGYGSDGNARATVYHGSTTGGASTFAPSGYFIGEPFDAGSGNTMTALKWNVALPNNTQLELKYRTANNLNDLASQSWTSAGNSVAGDNTFNLSIAQRYLQYRAEFSTTVDDKSPRLNRVELDYQQPVSPTPTVSKTPTTGPTDTPTITETPGASETPEPTETATVTPTKTKSPTKTPNPCAGKPAKPALSSPKNKSMVKVRKVKLKWGGSQCKTTKYETVVKKEKKKGDTVVDKKVKKTQLKTKVLNKGTNYFWHVKACNGNQCSKWSKWWKFKVSPNAK